MPLQADTLREKGCGSRAPFSSRGFFVALATRSGHAHSVIKQPPIRRTHRLDLSLQPCVVALACALAVFAARPAAHASPESWSRSAGPSRPGTPQAGLLVRVTDEMGRAVEIPEAARRIVSLAPNLTETLFALGLGDRVVGDTDFCDYPAEARSKPHVGGPVNPNLEAIAGLHPDLVLATRAINRPETVRGLEQLHIPIYATDPRSVEEVVTSTARLGELLGAGEQGKTVVADLRQRLGRSRHAACRTGASQCIFCGMAGSACLRRAQHVSGRCAAARRSALGGRCAAGLAQR